MMTAVKDEWIRLAMTDVNVVVELLLKLKQAQATKPAPEQAMASLKWGIRQPRSRTASMRCDAKRDGDFSTRCSPNTPLSWRSDGGGCDADASLSAADCFEETSGVPLLSRSNSKGTAVNETVNTITKRTRRKKTFAELREEENMLLKERIYLKKEIASMLATRKEQRARNEHLKRIKLDLNLLAVKNSSLVADEFEKVHSCQPRQRFSSCTDYFPSSLPYDRKPLLDSGDKDCFLLPDLNTMPTEEDSGTETLYGTN